MFSYTRTSLEAVAVTKINENFSGTQPRQYVKVFRHFGSYLSLLLHGVLVVW